MVFQLSATLTGHTQDVRLNIGTLQLIARLTRRRLG